ncbi:hypothetical protein E4U53_004030, partial [Claviceps sorghi]
MLGPQSAVDGIDGIDGIALASTPVVPAEPAEPANLVSETRTGPFCHAGSKRSNGAFACLGADGGPELSA